MEQPDPSPFSGEMRKRREWAGLSVRAAAAAAGFSEARWRQFELGYRRVAEGVYEPASPSTAKVRQIAQVLKWDAVEALRLAGLDREAELEQEYARGSGSDPVGATQDDATFVSDKGGDAAVAGVTNEQLLKEIRALRQEVDELKRTRK